MLDFVYLAQEMKLNCIQLIMIDAIKSVQVESTQHQVNPGEFLDECMTFTSKAALSETHAHMKQIM